MRKSSKRIEITSQNFPEELATPAESIRQAIIAADYAENGAPYDPFLMKFANESDFTNIWTSTSHQAVQFFQYNGARTDGFLPLGDYAVTSFVAFGQTPIMLLKASDAYPDALVHPQSFIWILDDAGSGNDNNISYWWPVAPEQKPGGPTYQAMGICVTNGQAPDPNNYWMVSTDYLMDAGVQPYWSDAGQGWKHHNGNLSYPVVTASEVADNLILAPTTMYSDEFTSDSGGVTNASSLLVKKLFLPVPGAGVPAPVYSDNNGSGSQTADGLVNVAVLPCNVISDTNASAAPQNSPFYYLAGQPFWQCTNAFPAPVGGVYAQSYTVGTRTDDSSTFQETTGVTVGADVGIEAGDSGGFSAHMSVSYTHEMSITTSASVGHDTETSETISINLPNSDRILIWQKVLNVINYRAQYLNGGVSVKNIGGVQYKASEITLTAKPQG